MPTTQLLIANPLALFDAATAGVSISSTFALPARSTQLTWQTFYGTNPASITMLLQISLDSGGHWATIDTSTAVAGEIRTVAVNGGLIRANCTGISGGVGMSVLVNAKDV